jgi:hypothetical protein
MVEEFVRNHTVLVAVLLGVSLVIDIIFTAATKGGEHALISFLAVFTSICFLFGAAYGFIPEQFFSWALSLCCVVYVLNRLRPARRF